MPIASAFGRTRSGRSAWPSALATGVIVSVVLGVTAALLRPGPDAALLAIVMVVVTLPVTTIGGWVLVIDRDTVRGATPRPEEWVDSAWVQRAGSGVCFDLIAVCGLGAAVFSLVPALAIVPAWAALGSVTVIAMADVWVRYQLLSRRAT